MDEDPIEVNPFEAPYKRKRQKIKKIRKIKFEPKIEDYELLAMIMIIYIFIIRFIIIN